MYVYMAAYKKVRATIVRSCADVAYIAIAFFAFREYFSFRFVSFRYVTILFNSFQFDWIRLELRAVWFDLLYSGLVPAIRFRIESNRIQHSAAVSAEDAS